MLVDPGVYILRKEAKKMPAVLENGWMEMVISKDFLKKKNWTHPTETTINKMLFGFQAVIE